MKKLNLFIISTDKKINAYLLYELVLKLQFEAKEKLIEFVNYASKVSDYYVKNKLPEIELKKYDKIFEHKRFINDLVMYAEKEKIDTEKKLQALKFQVIEKLQEIEQLYKEIYYKLK